MNFGNLYWLGVLEWILFIAACFVAWRRKRLLAWLAWVTLPFFALLGAGMAGAPAPELVWNAWAVSCIALPFWWLYRSRTEGERRPL